jgi:hypothetical protein
VTEFDNIPDHQGEAEESQEITITKEQLENLRKLMPQEIAGTPEWNIRVQVESAVNLYNKTGLPILDLP